MLETNLNTKNNPKLSRRHFLQWIVGLSATAGAMAGYVRVLEPRLLQMDEIEIALLGLPAELDGRRLAQLSDIHLSHFFSPERLTEALNRVERAAPDWLVLTGDFVGTNAQDAKGLIDPLRNLSMPVYACYGNHDYWSDFAVVSSCLQQANVIALRNEATQIDSGLWLAGTDDLWSGRPDLRAALRDIPEGAPAILLAHEPDYFDTVLHENAPIGLQLSGHSHGGQVRFPTLKPDTAGYYSFAPVLPQYGRRYPIGLRHINGRYLYTNRGLGTWPVPFRFNCRPELTIFTLRSA